MSTSALDEVDGEMLQKALQLADRSESEMKQKLMQLQNQLRRAKKEASTRGHKERLRRTAAAMKAEANQQDLRDSLVGVNPSHPDAVREFAEACNVRLFDLDPAQRSWMRLYRRVDADSSGLISFAEFTGLVRTELALAEADFNVERLKQTWVALDADGSGRISAGEFGRFMRLGEHVLRDGGQTWKERRLAEKRAIVEEVKKEKDLMFNRAVAKRAEASGVVASAEEVHWMSEAFNKALTELFSDGSPPTARSARDARDDEAGERQAGRGMWYTLFKIVDSDGSGQIDFGELRYMVREKLQISAHSVSEDALAALWVALDKDNSGLISAGEVSAHAHTPACAHARARSHTHARARSHTHAHARTHTRTHTPLMPPRAPRRAPLAVWPVHPPLRPQAGDARPAARQACGARHQGGLPRAHRDAAQEAVPRRGATQRV